MRHINPTFLKLTVGDTIEVRPSMYDRDWTTAIVEKITYTDFPIKNNPCTRPGRRYELFARIIDRTDYCPLILDEEDVRERDNCEACNGDLGGIKGNENIVDGKLICDYCHGDNL